MSPDGTAVFSTSFHIIKESSSFVRLPLERPLGGGGKARKGGGTGDGYQGKFTWKIENFTKLKDLLKKRKITSLCIKSRRFQVFSSLLNFLDLMPRIEVTTFFVWTKRCSSLTTVAL